RSKWLGNKFGSTRQAIDLWREDQEFGLWALGQLGSDRVFLQRYEDLIEKPRTVLMALCDFVDIPFSEQMMEFHSREGTREFAKRGPQWANLSGAIMSDNQGQYREVLSGWQIRAVETWHGPLMARFGYERSNP